LPILTYHSLGQTGSITSVEPSFFEETMARLIEAGFVAVDLPQWMAAGRPTIANGFAVTFDDGLCSILNGIDVLTRYSIPATVFLVTDRIGTNNDWPGQPLWVPRERLLDWSEIADLSTLGFSFGAHTATHPRLDRISRVDLEIELKVSREAIETQLNRTCSLLAYPYGISNKTIRATTSTRFEAATGTHLGIADSHSSLFDLPRIDAYYLKSSSVLERLLTCRLKAWCLYREGLRTIRSTANSLFQVTR
jgi:peptidoglycan/xylan/chitin deacetylase (PgdA/CDA1 family)